MKFYNLKVLLLAALFSPIALAAQTCTAEGGGNSTSYTGDCFSDESGRPYRTLIVTGKGTADLTGPSFQDLTGVTVIFESSVKGVFSEHTLVDADTKFMHTKNGAKLWIDTDSGTLKFGFTGNGNGNKVPDLQAKIDVCPSVCTLGQPNLASVAPVTLISWTAEPKEDHVALNWETADEEDNSHFVISHSIDGKQFSEIATVGGQGTTGLASTYAYRHQQPSAGVNYYRLEQYDFDGSRTELGVQSATWQSDDQLPIVLSPNPVASGQLLRVDGRISEDTEVEIFAPNGRHVGTHQIQGGTFRVPDLTPGVYTLRLMGQTARLVVAR